MIDGLVVLACLAAAAIGWRKGILRTALPAAAVGAGLGGAVLLHRPLGTLLVAHLGLHPVLASVAAGAGIVLLAVVAFRVVDARIRRSHGTPADAEVARGGPPVGPSLASRAGGSVLGAAWALTLCLVLVWGVESLAGLTGSADPPESVTGTVARTVATGLARTAASRGTGDALAASAAAAMVEDPAGFTEMVRRLAGSEDLRRLATDPDLPALLAEARVAELAARPELARLMEDPAFMDAARRLRILDTGDAGSPEDVASALTGALAPWSEALTALKLDPEAMESARRLDLPRRVASGQLVALLRDPDFATLSARVARALKRTGVENR